MDKGTKNLVTLGVVVALVLFIGGKIPGFGTQAVTSTGGTTQGGMTIFAGTPTLDWSMKDKTTGDQNSPGSWSIYRVTVNGSTNDYTGSETKNVSINDSVKVCLLPNITYYAVCEETTIAKTVTSIQLEALKQGSLSTYWNNDTENSTLRNAVGAQDELTAGDTDSPTLCIQGTTANASFGDGQFLVVFQYPANELNAAPVWSKGTRADDLIPATFSTDLNLGGSIGKVAYLVNQTLANTDTVCGVVTVQNGAVADGTIQREIDANVLDHFGYRNSVTDALEFGFAIVSNGNDTNSAANAVGLSNIYYTT